jgi:hypothetical protein
MSTGFLFYLVCEAIGTAAIPGLLCQPRVIVKMIVEKQMGCRLAGETKVLLGENLPQRHFCPSQNPTWPDPGLNSGRRCGKPATNRLSYGHVGFCDGQKWRWGRFSPRTSVSPANLHSIRFSTIIFIITRGWHNRSGVAAVPIASQTK